MANKSLSLVHIHAEALTHDHLLQGPVQIDEPNPDDAAVVPEAFEDLEAQLWCRRPASLPAADAAEVLHPVAGIELDV